MIDFDPYDLATIENPYPIYKRLRDEAPLNYNPTRDIWTLARHADVLEAHRDFATYSSAGGVSMEGLEKHTAVLIVKDPPEHRWHKALVKKVFTRERMGSLEPYIRNRVRLLLDRAAEMGDFDFVQDFSVQLPLDVIGEMIGIPEEVRPDIHHFSNQMISRDASGDMTKAYEAQIALNDIYLNLIRDRRRVPREDVITFLMNSEERDDSGVVHRMSDHELAARFGELGFAGHETVAKAIPNGAMAFHAFPNEWRRLISREKTPADAADEIVRFDPPSQLQGRTTTRDVTMYGVTMPEGVKIMLLTGAATRDERAFENPDTFDIGRKTDITAVFYGFGVHRCLGMHLARIEIRIAFEEILARFPHYEVDPSRAVHTVMSNVRGVSTLPANLRASH